MPCTLCAAKNEPDSREPGQAMTGNQGLKVSDDQHGLKAGPRGSTLLEDFYLREKITHFDHERIPERVVHARGAAAHGVFQVYEDLSDLTKSGITLRSGQGDTGLRPLLDGRRLARLVRYRSRRARFRRQVLHG
jgi:catalase